MMKITSILLVLLCWAHSILGQVELEFIQPIVMRNNVELDLAFAGGINSAQYQTIDLDGDDDLDLILFDRSSDKVNCFENTGQAYLYNPAFESLFPDNIQHWLILADYDCDGQKDLFTYTGQGIRVFRNLAGVTAPPSWELVVEPVKTQGSSSQINLLFNPTDIPSISDLDNDGDLDILVFDFASSFQLEFHQNHSIENTGSCSLDFVRETRTYGDIRDCGCDDFTVDEACGASGRILHAGGKAILSLDYNVDGLIDLVLSQEGCNNLSISQNTGTITNASFDPFNNNFPNLTAALNFTSFPAAFYEDVTFDGKKDLLISSNERSNDDQNIDFKSSSFLHANMGENGTNQFSNSIPFLQNRMIDVGEYAYPAIIDINGDGNNDLLLSNAGSLHDGNYISSLTYFEAAGTQLVWQADDLFGLSALGFAHIKPQFIDLNNDQSMDLVFSAWNTPNAVNLYYLLNEGNADMSFDLAQLNIMNFTFGAFDDFHLTDVDEDGFPDLLLGQSSGQLDYYRNTGTSLNPVFAIETSAFLEIGADGDRSNLSVTTGDLDNDGMDDLITTDRSGQTVVYSNYKSGNASRQESLIKSNAGQALTPSRLGRVSKPTSGLLLGRNSLAIGSIQGGVRLLSSSGVSGENELTLQAYPVPTFDNRVVNFVSNLSDTRLEIFTIAGRKITEISLSAYSPSSLSLSHLEDGLYLAKATNGSQSCTAKIVLSRAY